MYITRDVKGCCLWGVKPKYDNEKHCYVLPEKYDTDISKLMQIYPDIEKTISKKFLEMNQCLKI